MRLTLYALRLKNDMEPIKISWDLDEIRSYYMREFDLEDRHRYEIVKLQVDVILMEPVK